MTYPYGCFSTLFSSGFPKKVTSVVTCPDDPGVSRTRFTVLSQSLRSEREGIPGSDRLCNRRYPILYGRGTRSNNTMVIVRSFYNGNE